MPPSPGRFPPVGAGGPIRDNLSAVRPRPPGVRTDDLEQALRRCLADHAAGRPRTTGAVDTVDVADWAIRRARRHRRVRAGGAAAFGICLLAAASVASGQVLPASGRAPTLLAEPAAPPPPVQTASPAPAAAAPLPLHGDLRRQPLAAAPPLPVDLVVAGELHTTDGRQVDLGPIEAVAQASRMSDGWLLVGEAPADDPAEVWFVTPDAPPKPVLTDVDAVAVDPAGSRIAWRHGAQLAVASLVSGELTNTTTSKAPEPGRPVGFAGDAVLLARDGDGNGRALGVWRPGQGGLPRWTDSASAVYGALPDGRTVVAQVSDGGGRSCLALLDVARELVTTRSACALPLTGDGRGAVSADGRWLVANGVADARSASESELAMLVDLEKVFDDQVGSVREAGQRLTGATVWADQVTVVHAAGVDQVVRINVDRISNEQEGAVEQVDVPLSAVGTVPVLVAGFPDRR